MDASTYIRLQRNRALVSNPYTKVPGVSQEVMMERRVGGQSFIQDKKLVQACCSQSSGSPPPPAFNTRIEIIFEGDYENKDFTIDITCYDATIDWGNGDISNISSSDALTNTHGSIIIITSNTSITQLQIDDRGLPQLYTIHIVEAPVLQSFVTAIGGSGGDDEPIRSKKNIKRDIPNNGIVNIICDKVLPVLDYLNIINVNILFTTIDVGKYPALKEFYIYTNYDTIGNISLLENFSNLPLLTNLEILQCNNNNLQNIDVSGCINLQSLDCSYNVIENINVTDCTKLKTLLCLENNISSLDLSTNTDLAILNCENNTISGNIDLSANRMLTEINYSFNNIASIDISGLNLLERLDVRNNNLTSLDVSTNTALIDLYCTRNNIQGVFNLSNNNNLQNLGCVDNNIKSITLNTTSLETFECNDNDISGSLDLSTNTQLTYINIENNHINAINVSGLTQLETLVISNNNIHSIDISTNNILTTFNATQNPISTLDVSTNTELQDLSYALTDISGVVDISTNTKLLSVICNNTRIHSLDISNNPLLERVFCYNTDISGLDISNNTQLRVLHCYNTDISSLDISGVVGLYVLRCNNTQIDQTDANTIVEILDANGLETNEDEELYCSLYILQSSPLIQKPSPLSGSWLNLTNKGWVIN